MIKLSNTELMNMFRENLYYERHTGELRWFKRGIIRPHGKLAGSEHPLGYRSIQVNKVKMFAHQIIFLLEHGYIPSVIDHIDGSPRNNHHSNLRDASNGLNNRNRGLHRNNTSGYIGVSKAGSKWRAAIIDLPKIGRCETPEEASAWRGILQRMVYGNEGREHGEGAPLHIKSAKVTYLTINALFEDLDSDKPLTQTGGVTNEPQ